MSRGAPNCLQDIGAKGEIHFNSMSLFPLSKWMEDRRRKEVGGRRFEAGGYCSPAHSDAAGSVFTPALIEFPDKS